MPRERLGVAVVLDDPVRSEVFGLRRAIGCPSLLTQPPHITLVPPVNVRVEEIDQVLESTRLICARTSAIRVRLGPLRTFSPISPVVYLAVDGDEVSRLEALRTNVFTGPLLRKVSYEYIPHCTVHEDASVELITAAMLAMGEYRRVIDIRSVDILRQDDDRVWRTLASFPLAAPTVRGRGGIEVGFSMTASASPRARDLLLSAERRAGVGTWCIEARAADGVVVGVATGVIHRGVCTVSAFVVDELHRGLGVGSHLLTEVLLHADSTEATEVRVEEPTEPWTRAWLERRSFVSSRARAMVRTQ